MLTVKCSEPKSSSSYSSDIEEKYDTIPESVEEYNHRKRNEALAKNKKDEERFKSKISDQPKIRSKWYEGGTLHKSKIREWKNATEANRLATCADFAAKIDNSVTMDILLRKATALKACISEATRDLDSTNEENVSDVAVMCAVTLGYN